MAEKILEIGAHIGGIWTEYKPNATHVSLDLEYTRPLIPVEKQFDVQLDRTGIGTRSRNLGQMVKRFNKFIALKERLKEPPLVQANGSRLPFARHSFDEIHTRNVLQHLPVEGKNSVEELALEMARVSNGKILVTCFRQPDVAPKAAEKMRATKEKVIEVLRLKGFRVEVFEGEAFHNEVAKTYATNTTSENLRQYPHPFLIKATKIKIKPKK